MIQTRMLKNIICLTASFALCIGLAGCGKEKPPTMQLTKAQLTQEELDISTLLQADPTNVIYDYTVDDTLKKISINTYELGTDGSWKTVSGGGGLAVDSSQGRIALNYDKLPEGMAVAVQDKSGTTASRYTPDLSHSFEGMTVAATVADDPVDIVYETEIPLVIQIITTQNGVHLYDEDYFYNPEEYAKQGHEHVYAVTVTFSQKPLE